MPNIENVWWGGKLLISIRSRYVDSLTVWPLWEQKGIRVSFLMVKECVIDGVIKGENRAEGNEAFKGVEWMKIAYLLVCRWAGIMQWKWRGSENDDNAFCWSMQKKGSESH